LQSRGVKFEVVEEFRKHKVWST